MNLAMEAFSIFKTILVLYKHLWLTAVQVAFILYYKVVSRSCETFVGYSLENGWRIRDPEDEEEYFFESDLEVVKFLKVSL